MHNHIAIIIISVILVLATIGGVVVMLIPKNTAPPVDTEPPKDTESTITGDSTTEPPESTKRPELTSPPESHKPIPDLKDGDEAYLDMDVVSKLQAMEDLGNGDEVNVILDTMFLLINEFVSREYSALAIAQIQRFYFSYRTEIGDIGIDVLYNKIGECITAEGADRNTFASKVQLNFGFGDNTDFSYIFDTEVSS